MVDLILFPSSYFNASKVDEDLQDEYDAVKESKRQIIQWIEIDITILDN